MYYATLPDAYGASDLLMLDGTTVSVLHPGVLMCVPVHNAEYVDIVVPDAGSCGMLLVPLTADQVCLYLEDCELAI